MKNRVLVTWLGAGTPVGNDVQTKWDNMLEGKSVVDLVNKVNRDDFPAKVAAEVKDFDYSQYISKKDARKMDLFTQYAVAASKMAVDDANLVIDEKNADRVGVWIGSGIGDRKSTRLNSSHVSISYA